MMMMRMRRRSNGNQPLNTIPNTIRHSGRKFMALELLIDQPHSNDELVPVQEAVFLSFDEISDLE